MAPAQGMNLAGYNENTFKDVDAGAGKAAEASGAPSSYAILGLWALFVANRALHPLVIDISKDADGNIPYNKLSPVIAKSFLSLIACNVCAFFDVDGFSAGLRKCYTGPSIWIFAWIGCMYALGDYLEMMSMGCMDGAAYQVLLQSKLMITAVMMWIMKGRAARQSPTQWSVLFSIMTAMIVFMLVQANAEAASGACSSKSSSSGWVGLVFAVSKVWISCYAAVSTDKSLKQYRKLPLYAQISQLMGSWGLVSVVMAAVLEPQALSSGAAFFEGWGVATLLIVVSFAMKTILTMTLLKVLDSVQKNIGEAVAVIVIYGAQVLLPSFDKQFEMTSFLSMAVVVMTVTTYVLLKQELVTAVEVGAAKKEGTLDERLTTHSKATGGPRAVLERRPSAFDMLISARRPSVAQGSGMVHSSSESSMAGSEMEQGRR